VAPDLVLDYHRLRTPIDHPDGSVTAAKLATLDYVTLKGLTADPPLAPGRIWFRSDLGQLRYTPDGTTVYVIDPAPVVDKSWSDTSAHYFNFDPAYQVWQNPAAVQLDSPAAGHKRAFEDLSTGYLYVHGWLVKRSAALSTRLDVAARIGAYHGADATRANVNFVIADPATVDVRARNDNVPWVRAEWTLSALGYANGSYGNRLSGYVVFTDPPSFSFSPANPTLSYNRITGIPGGRRHVLYGYADRWAGDWDVWASLQRGVANTNLRFRVATEAPEPEVLLDLSAHLPVDSAAIARWDGEVRLWVKRGEAGLVAPLGASVELLERRVARRSLSPNLFERVLRSGREPELEYDVVEVRFRTDRRDAWRASDEWRLVILSRGERVEVFLGDRAWDGDRCGYYNATL